MEDTLNRNLFRLTTIMVAAGISESRIGRSAIKNARIFDHIRGGGGYTVRTYDGIVQWVSDHWPADLKWPADIERPAPKEIKDGE